MSPRLRLSLGFNVATFPLTLMVVWTLLPVVRFLRVKFWRTVLESSTLLNFAVTLVVGETPVSPLSGLMSVSTNRLAVVEGACAVLS
jgi:hypothetical protein